MIGTLGAMLLSEIFQEKLLKLHEFALHFNSEALSFHLFSTYTRKQKRQKVSYDTFNQKLIKCYTLMHASMYNIYSISELVLRKSKI